MTCQLSVSNANAMNNYILQLQQLHDLSLRSRYRECVSRWHELIHQGVALVERRLVASRDIIGASYRHVNKRIASRSTVGAIGVVRY